jgi:hypothetical protein
MTYNFDADLRHIILTTMPCEAVDRPALEALDTSHLAFHYWNWRSRFIPVQKYSVHRSDSLLEYALGTEVIYGAALQHIVDSLEFGVDITPHLSRKVKVGFVDQKGTQKNLGKRRDLDLLLNDWGIHHLHLSTNLETDGFVARKKPSPLLFAAFKGTDAYLIDIFDHDGAWANVDIIRIIARNWPQSGLILELNGIDAQPWSETERLDLRRAGLNTTVEVDGKAYLARGGLTLSGMSVYAVQAIIQLRRHWDWFDKQLPNPEQWVRGMMLKANVKPPCELDLHFRLLPNGYGILENNTMFLIKLA